MKRDLQRWILTAVAGLASVAGAQTLPREQPGLEAPKPAILERAGFVQKMGAPLPLEAAFRDDEGRIVRMGDYFDGRRPVILVLGYYECPMLCNLVLNGLVQSVRDVSLDLGDEYAVVMVSVDPEETHVLAARKKATYLAELGRSDAAGAWHFLTGDEASIQSVAGAVGFRYELDPATGEYAHGSGIMVITPEGKVSHYLFGVEYPSRDLRLALVEASQGRIGSALDKFQLFCYQYDHVLGRYSARIMAVVQVGCAATLVALATFLVVMFRREAAQRAAAA